MDTEMFSVVFESSWTAMVQSPSGVDGTRRPTHDLRGGAGREGVRIPAVGAGVSYFIALTLLGGEAHMLAPSLNTLQVPGAVGGVAAMGIIEREGHGWIPFLLLPPRSCALFRVTFAAHTPDISSAGTELYRPASPDGQVLIRLFPGILSGSFKPPCDVME